MAAPTITAWRPPVEGITEVFHARFREHAYPAHTHDAWTLLIVDDGAVAYDLAHTAHGALRDLVTLLPPHVPHDGRTVTPNGFGKRVLYLDEAVIGSTLIGQAVDNPGLRDPLLRHRVHQLHEVLQHPGDELEAGSRLALVADRLRQHLQPADRTARRTPPADHALAARLRDLLDATAPIGVTLNEAATTLDRHPTHLVRAFTTAYGIPPHRYLTGRRVDHARSLLLAGHPPAEVAVAAGFYDQSHLNRHFHRMLGISPGAFRRGMPHHSVAGRFTHR